MHFMVNPFRWKRAATRHFLYARHNPQVDRPGLDALGLDGINLEHVQAMDAMEHIGAIQKVGAARGKKHVNMAPFKKVHVAMTQARAGHAANTVVALAGRRIDAGDEGRFPLVNVPIVRDCLLSFFQTRHIQTLVSSAACGADLISLDMAGQLGVRRRIILPFDHDRFRETSVVDRPGEWGLLYDRVVEAVMREGDLVVLKGAGEDGVAYAAANERILEETLQLALAGVAPPPGPEATRPISPEAAFALIVWDGRSRGEDDSTEQFAASARRRGLVIEEVLTI
jgi:hypothetical protein